MGWPKGRPRGPRKSAPIAGTDIPPQPALRKKYPGMKAGANWETIDDRGDSIDRFHIPPRMIPEDMSLQWVTDTVMGAPVPELRADFERKGWTPVHQSDFEGRFDGMFMSKGQDGEINSGGQVLMARPAEITKRAEAKEYRRAKEQVRIKEAALRGGDIPGVSLDSEHKSALMSNKISRSWESIAVPRDSEDKD